MENKIENKNIKEWFNNIFYQTEKGIIINDDCLIAMKNIPNKSIDMILCDLPYGTTACKWDTIIPFEPLWEQYNRIIKDNGAIVLTASQPFTTKLINSNIKMFKYCWIWNKKAFSNQMMAKYQPLRITEDICVFNSKIYYPQDLIRCNKITKQGTKITDNIGGVYAKQNIFKSSQITLKTFWNLAKIDPLFIQHKNP